MYESLPAVQTATHLLVANPQSMPSILEEDDDVLLHESVHLSNSQVQRQLYGLHSELVFFEWLEDHLDEESVPGRSRAQQDIKPGRYPALEALVSRHKNGPGASSGGRTGSAGRLDL